MLRSKRAAGSFLTYMLIAVGTFAMATVEAQAGPKSPCRWVLDRDEGPLEDQSPISMQFKKVGECVNDAVVGILTAPCDSSPKAFDAKIFFKASNGKVATCTTQTIKPINCIAWHRKLKNYIESKRDYRESDESYFNLLQGKEWTNKVNEHVRVLCQ